MENNTLIMQFLQLKTKLIYFLLFTIRWHNLHTVTHRKKIKLHFSYFLKKLNLFTLTQDDRYYSHSFYFSRNYAFFAYIFRVDSKT